MKADIHPTYEATTITCGCGAVIETRSTGKELRIEICSKCHPFYTGGGDRLVDTEGRIDKFKKRFNMEGGEGGALAAIEKQKQAVNAKKKKRAQKAETAAKED